MPLMPDDIKYLNDKGIVFEIKEQDGRTYVIIKDYILPDIYTQEKVDILMIVNPLYPNSSMDMFWVIPEIKLRSNNSYPACANVFENYLGLAWQRFSRHYPWRPGISSIISHFKAVQNSLLNP